MLWFKRKPEDDVAQYYVVIRRWYNEKEIIDWEYAIIESKLPFEKNRHWPTKKQCPDLKRITVKKAVELIKHRGGFIYLDPKILDDYIINYVKANLPAGKWKWESYVANYKCLEWRWYDEYL